MKYNIYNTKDYIDKFREFLIIKKTSETKSERNKRTEEIHNNQLEIIHQSKHYNNLIYPIPENFDNFV